MSSTLRAITAYLTRVFWLPNLIDSKALMKKIKWVDLYRLAIKSFPGSYNFRLRTLLNKFSIQTKKTKNFRYQSISSSGDQQCCEEFSLFEQGEIKWQEGSHDAMCDSLATHSLLKKLLEKNSYSNIAELVDKFRIISCFGNEVERSKNIWWRA